MVCSENNNVVVVLAALMTQKFLLLRELGEYTLLTLGVSASHCEGGSVGLVVVFSAFLAA